MDTMIKRAAFQFTSTDGLRNAWTPRSSRAPVLGVVEITQPMEMIIAACAREVLSADFSETSARVA